jgi:hypothetical protein
VITVKRHELYNTDGDEVVEEYNGGEERGRRTTSGNRQVMAVLLHVSSRPKISNDLSHLSLSPSDNVLGSSAKLAKSCVLAYSQFLSISPFQAPEA